MKNKVLVSGLIIFAFILRIVPLIQNRNLMTSENFIKTLLALVIGIFILILIYLISLKVSKSREAALFSLALASVIPFYSWRIGNTLSSAIGAFFFFLIIYLIPKIHNNKYYLLALALPLLYSLFNPCSWILIFVLIMYLLLIRIEHLKKDKIEDYFLFISLTAMLLLTFAFSYSGSVAYFVRSKFLEFLHLSYSLSSINKFNLNDLFYLIGPLPVLFGMLGIYISMKKEERMPLLLFSAAGSSFLVTLVLGNIFSYIYFSLTMACLASFSYLWFKEKLNQSKLYKFTNIILGILTLGVLIMGASRWILF